MLLDNAPLKDKIKTAAELDRLPYANFISSRGLNKLKSQLQSDTGGITLIADFWNHHPLVNVFIPLIQKPWIGEKVFALSVYFFFCHTLKDSDHQTNFNIT